MGMQARNLKQKATHWTAVGDGFGGFTYGTPAIIKCRWEARNAVFRDSQGEEVTSSALVYLASDVSIGDYVYEGETTVADPTTLTEARRVRQFNKMTDLRAIDVQRLAYL